MVMNRGAESCLGPAKPGDRGQTHKARPDDGLDPDKREEKLASLIDLLVEWEEEWFSISSSPSCAKLLTGTGN